MAFVIDVFARRIVGWRASRTAHAGFVLDALEQAIHQRRPAQDQLVHHSDRGSQYLSIKYTERLAEAKIAPSVAAIVTRTDGVPRRPSGIPMTMPWPKRSMACSKPKSFTDAGHGAVLRPSNTRPWNGSIGSTIAACWSLSGISRQMKQRQTSMPLWKDQTWPRNQDKSASGKSGAVHQILSRRWGVTQSLRSAPISDVRTRRQFAATGSAADLLNFADLDIDCTRIAHLQSLLPCFSETVSPLLHGRCNDIR